MPNLAHIHSSPKAQRAAEAFDCQLLQGAVLALKRFPEASVIFLTLCSPQEGLPLR